MPLVAPTTMIFFMLMREIRFVFSFDALHGRIEIAEFHIWEFLMDKLLQLFYAHAFAGVGDAQLAQIPVRVYIKIAPLDHCEIGGADELAQRFVFFDAVRHAREDEIVYRG